MEMKLILLQNLVPYEKNPRKNDAAVDKVAASIKQFGFRVPLVVDADNVIVAGHTRYKAAVKLGLESIPCVVATDLTPEQIKAYRLADNKVAEFSDWDFELLEQELAEITLDMEQFNFVMPDELDVSDEDFLLEERKAETKAKACPHCGGEL